MNKSLHAMIKIQDLRNIKRSLLMAFFAFFLTFTKTFALTGDIGAHDPSGIVKCAGRYYIFTTGGGVGVKSSADLIHWVAEKSAFGSTIPEWIKDYVPDFTGGYWAPNCIFMNGRYYLYYTAAKWGTPYCAIGVASNPTLDPKSPNYKWTDLGRVVNATSNKNIDAIDPYTFRDTNKKVYLTYGGYVGGNAVGELDTITGKLKNGYTKIASKGEGTSIIKNGNYYYFFEQHGSCCSGINSTYYISCGRSTSPLGPFVDASGTSLITSYGVDVIKKSGKYIGPGHSAFYTENGITFVSYHYYDGNNGGSNTLGIGKIIFENGWPKIIREWLPDGNYSVTGNVSLKSWEANTSNGTISLNTQSKTNTAQRFNFTAQGNGIYTITASNNKAVEVAGCANTNGAKIQTNNAANTNCQKFLVERTPTSFVLTPVNTINEGSRAAKFIGTIGNATTSGTQMETRDYTNGGIAQKWLINPFGTITAIDELTVNDLNGQAICYPNPFTKEIIISSQEEFDYAIYDMSGAKAESGTGRGNTKAGDFLPAGVYVLSIRTASENKVFKVRKQ